jgi:hypothetical protein
MKKHVKIKFVLAIGILVIVATNSCKKDEEATSTDKELYEMAKATEGFTWFKHSNELLDKSIASGHSQPFLRTRYNSIAATNLDSVDRIKQNSTFPEGSLIVKELYSNETSLSQYAILYKETSNPSADAKGWVWGYMSSDGTVSESSSNKGSACISCHSQLGNTDYMLMNKYFP